MARMILHNRIYRVDINRTKLLVSWDMFSIDEHYNKGFKPNPPAPGKLAIESSDQNGTRLQRASVNQSQRLVARLRRLSMCIAKWRLWAQVRPKPGPSCR